MINSLSGRWWSSMFNCSWQNNLCPQTKRHAYLSNACIKQLYSIYKHALRWCPSGAAERRKGVTNETTTATATIENHCLQNQHTKHTLDEFSWKLFRIGMLHQGISKKSYPTFAMESFYLKGKCSIRIDISRLETAIIRNADTWSNEMTFVLTQW